MSQNFYTQLPGNPYLRNALDTQNTPAVRQVFATLAQAFETRTLIVQHQEQAATKAMHNRQGFSTPASIHLSGLRAQLQARTTPEPDDE